MRRGHRGSLWGNDVWFLDLGAGYKSFHFINSHEERGSGDKEAEHRGV